MKTNRKPPTQIHRPTREVVECHQVHFFSANKDKIYRFRNEIWPILPPEDFQPISKQVYSFWNHKHQNQSKKNKVLFVYAFHLCTRESIRTRRDVPKCKIFAL